ncbi:MAG: hypothetical protein WCA12_12440 [Burkholderiales bacterium]
MSTDVSTDSSEHGPWNPGINSELPPRLLPLSTIFRLENVFTSAEHVAELRDLTGLDFEELVIFRPERLVVHELLIRVTADLSVPDGIKVEDLGINFRRMTHTILSGYIEPHMDEIVGAYASLRATLSNLVNEELSARFGSPPPRADGVSASGTRRRGLLHCLGSLGRRAEADPDADDERARDERVLREWTAKAQSSEDPLRRAAYRALVRVVSSVIARHGRMWGDAALLAPIATGLACNEQGSEEIGRLIEPHFRTSAAAEGYQFLPAQARPVVMNTKGASASGKSTMRPLQKRFAAEIALRWSDFGVISPDIWRKYLLDYSSLGEAYRYAGAFTGSELAIIDRKLDRYMAWKADRGAVSHLLIDRFRFDSFAPESGEVGSNLLTRFGHLVYMFFMVTPPHETVERSWKRGLNVGRYKAVDDLLAHNIEAYTGMPGVFFTWALRPGMSVHYEFLDNDVALGEQPRTAAFGWNGEMNILDVKCMLDIDRYRNINLNASRPEDVYPDRETMAPENNTQFLLQCVRMLPTVNLAHHDTGRIYARLESGQLSWTDPEALNDAARDPETRAGILAIAPDALSGVCRSDDGSQRAIEVLQAARFHTLGRWGERLGPGYGTGAHHTRS